ncbi:phospholipase A2 group XV-like [Corticium candelabrum]|uniref:phospholipase A2 group XV-like n=1 Tax=Corticium candelabrum TaxID=121492 RepID=UPI002E25BF2D|nr:phospholipase A2 group XV-like [Corticium candelabrum]
MTCLRRRAIIETLFILSMATAVIGFIPSFRRQASLDPRERERLLKSIEPAEEEQMSPVVLVTALCGAQLWAQWDFKENPHFWCHKKSEVWQQVWLNLLWFLPLERECWRDIVKLRYNSSTHQYYPWVPGVIISVGNGTEHIRYIDQDYLTHSETYEYDMIIDALKQAGYTPDKNIIAFPFDWRLGPDAYFLDGGVFDVYQSSIEKAYSNNGNKPVVIVAESMGNAVTNLFLHHHVNQTWKDKYIKSLVSLSGIYAGTGIALYSTVTETTYDLPEIIGKELITDVLRTLGGIAWLYPDAEYWGDAVFMTTPAANYTARDIPTILTKAKLPHSLELYNGVKNLTVRTAPNVTVYCYYGEDIKTSNYFVYDNDQFQGDPQVFTTSGDGSVPLHSLEVCKSWITQQSKPVYTKSMTNVTHQGILHNHYIIRQIVSIATGNVTKSEY